MTELWNGALQRIQTHLRIHYGHDLEVFHRAGFVSIISLVLIALLMLNTLIFILGYGVIYDVLTSRIVIVGGLVMALITTASTIAVLRGKYFAARWIIAATMTLGVSCSIVFFGSITASPAMVILVMPVVLAYCTMPRREALIVAALTPTIPITVHLASKAFSLSIPDYTSQAFPEINVIVSVVAATVIIAVCMANQSRSQHNLVQALAEDRQRHAILADQDSLTGLGNRRAFDRELHQATDIVATGGMGFILVLLDMDKFKPVNDRHGHKAGDMVLKMIAEHLVATFRTEDMVARIGGDEFAIIVRETGAKALQNLLARLSDSVSQPIRIGDNTVQLAVSVGTAQSCGSQTDADKMFMKADAELYLQKRRETPLFQSLEIAFKSERVA